MLSPKLTIINFFYSSTPATTFLQLLSNFSVFICKFGEELPLIQRICHVPKFLRGSSKPLSLGEGFGVSVSSFFATTPAATNATVNLPLKWPLPR